MEERFGINRAAPGEPELSVRFAGDIPFTIYSPRFVAIWRDQFGAMHAFGTDAPLCGVFRQPTRAQLIAGILDDEASS